MSCNPGPATLAPTAVYFDWRWRKERLMGMVGIPPSSKWQWAVTCDNCGASRNALNNPVGLPSPRLGEGWTTDHGVVRCPDCNEAVETALQNRRRR